jgi:hypothetical protein
MLIRQNGWRTALLRLSRPSALMRATAERLTLVELNDFIKIDVKSRCYLAGLLSVICYF